MTTHSPAMSDHDALSVAIFALNTLADPAASSAEDMAALAARTEEALKVLTRLRRDTPAAATGPVTLDLPLGKLLPGDRLVSVGATAYSGTRIVQTALGPIDGTMARGVEFVRRPGETTRFVLYPDAVRGQRILVTRG